MHFRTLHYTIKLSGDINPIGATLESHYFHKIQLTYKHLLKYHVFGFRVQKSNHDCSQPRWEWGSSAQTHRTALCALLSLTAMAEIYGEKLHLLWFIYNIIGFCDDVAIYNELAHLLDETAS